MAIELIPVPSTKKSRAKHHEWIFTAAGELLTESLSLMDYPDKTIGSVGTTINGKQVTIQGSFDETDEDSWFTMLDINGVEIIFTGLGQSYVIRDNPPFIRGSLNNSAGVDFKIGVVSAR
jgi:hypothetical protein